MRDGVLTVPWSDVGPVGSVSALTPLRLRTTSGLRANASSTSSATRMSSPRIGAGGVTSAIAT